MARRDGWRGSGCSLTETTFALGESKTLKPRRCAACVGMHVDGERSSPKNGSNLAGECPPPPQAAGHLTSEMDRHQTEPVPCRHKGPKNDEPGQLPCALSQRVNARQA